MKRDTLFTIVLMVICIGLMIGTFFTDKNPYSQVENRYLAKLSFDNLDEYVSDYFPFRTELISIKNHVEKALGKTLINGIYLADDDYLIPQFVESDKKDVVIEVINNYAKDKTVDVMLVPDSIAINKDKLKRALIDSEEKDIDYFYKNLNTNNINLIDSFKEYEDEEKYLYYHNDHHWTSDGAFLAYREYMKSIGMKIDENFQRVMVSDDFYGTSSSLVLGLAKPEKIYIYDYKNNLELEYVNENTKSNSLYNMEYLEKKDQYAMFLDGNHALIHITNKDLDDGSILVIKNSYANCFIPFIVNNFRDVYVMDMRYYNDNVSEFTDANSIDRTMILYNIENLYSDLSIVKLK